MAHKLRVHNQFSGSSRSLPDSDQDRDNHTKVKERLVHFANDPVRGKKSKSLGDLAELVKEVERIEKLMGITHESQLNVCFCSTG